MIGMELLNLLQGGDPMYRALAPPNPNPQPSPQAPPQEVGDSPQFLRNLQQLQRQHALGAPGTTQQITPPPFPNANVQGGSPAPGALPSPQGGQGQPLPQSGPPSSAPQSPPDLASLYMQLMQRQRSANEIDRGLALMASAYAAPGTQGQIMHSMDQNQPDPGQMMGNLLQMQYMSRLANMPAPGSGGAATGGAAIDPTVWNSMTPQMREKYLSDAAGKSLDVQTQKQEGINKDVQEFKNTGIQDFSAADQKLRESEAGVDTLLNNMPATMKALAAPDLLTTSKAAAWLPSGLGYGEDVRQAAIAKEKLIAGLTGESLSNVKNVRNQREFSTLGEALTAGLNANNGQQGVQDALNSIKQRMATAHANVYATAGKEIPYQYNNMADPSYTSPTINGQPNPYFTGATYEKPPQNQGAPVIGGPGAAYDALPRGSIYTGPDGKQYRKS